jgi:pimeloyl-ACP methyl ester carboxylesterase
MHERKPMNRTPTARAVLTLVLFGGAASAQPPADPLAKAPSHFVTSDGLRVHYKSLGEGKTALVLVHDWTGSMEGWRYQVRALDGKPRLILIDLPGHGKSDKPEVNYTMDRFARAVDAVLADAGVDQAVLAGHSMGTPVARQYYRLYPKKVKGLVVVDGALRAIGKPMADKFLANWEGPGFKDKVGKLIETMFANKKAPAEFREAVKAVSQATPQQVALSALRGRFDPALWKDDEIRVPVLVVLAKNPLWDADYEKYVRRIAPQVEYQVWDAVGHFLHAEEPEAFNKLLVAFLKKQGVLR